MTALASDRAQRADTLPLAVWAGVAAGTTLATCIAPLATYVLMVAAFGLPHVLCELRYCDQRFAGASSIRAVAVIGMLVGAIAALRIAGGTGLMSSYTAMLAELGLGGVLAIAAAWFMRRLRFAGLAIGAAFGLGAVYYPIATFLTWAWLHNLTPLGFVAEATEGEERRRLLLTLSFFFLVVPALVATGVFHDAVFTLTGWNAAEGPSAFGAGTRPLGSFLSPSANVGSDTALFSAAVVAQAMHYVAVILFLPRLIARRDGIARGAPLLPWPSWSVFMWMVAAVAAAGFVGYAVDYGSARAAYGVAAAIHAWVELPIFLLALGGGFTSARR